MLINGYKKRQLNVNLLYELAVYVIIIVYYKNIIKIVYIFTRVTFDVILVFSCVFYLYSERNTEN